MNNKKNGVTVLIYASAGSLSGVFYWLHVKNSNHLYYLVTCKTQNLIARVKLF